MNRVIKRVSISILIFVLMLSAGCWDQKKYEEIGFILQLGLEADQDGRLLYSISYPVVSGGMQEEVAFLHTSSHTLLRASRDQLRNTSGKLLQAGKVQHVYFSQKLAKEGINPYLEIFFRDPENPLLANVIVIDGSPREMIEYSLKYKDKPRPAFYVNGLLVDARKRSIVPETRIYNFSILKYSQTIDPMTPLFKYNKKSIEAAGSAVFSGDKMVGKLDTEQTKLVNTMSGEDGQFEFVYEGEEIPQVERGIKQGIAVFIKKSKPKIKVNTQGDKPVIEIKLEQKAVVDEFSGAHNLAESENMQRLEAVLSRVEAQDCLKVLTYLQSIGADPIGFGELVRAKNSAYWKSVRWKDVYKTAVFKVEVKLKIESYGTIE